MNTIVVLYYLSNPFDGAHAMLALATSLSAWIQVILLYLRLKKEEVVYNSNIFNKEPFISIVSCIIMLVILGSILIQPIELAKNEYYIRGLLLGLYIITGGLVYIISMYILGYKFKKSLS
jgi:peptidoglycan biosynthesis protein MviN/MurJ (putative lipid II flippase)